MRKMLRVMAEIVRRVTAPGAALNAMGELDRAATAASEVDAQLRRVVTATSASAPHAA